MIISDFCNNIVNVKEIQCVFINSDFPTKVSILFKGREDIYSISCETENRANAVLYSLKMQMKIA